MKRKRSTNPTSELKRLARIVHNNAEARKAATRNESKALKEMHAIMQDNGMDSHECKILASDGSNIPIEITLDAPVRNVVNIAKLAKKVTVGIFHKCVSATQNAVKEHAGSAVLTSVLEEEKGEEKVYVKVKK